MRVVIVDDEPLARNEIARLLSQQPDIEVVAQCANAIEAIAAINRLHPDAIFLDIQMPTVNGMEMLGMLDPERTPRVVFLTAYSEHALEAFDRNAFDYLLKPIDPARLDTALTRLRRDGAAPPQGFDATALLRQIPCPGHHRVLLIRLDDIEYATSKTTGVYITTTQGAEHFTELTLRTLEEKTPFLRCHRQYLVNPEHIQEICFAEAGTVEIVTRHQHRLPVSRRLLPELKERLGLG
ncbi:MAG: two-component system response regulator BtsR [Azoarcus sp.]|jgi:two-component system LytT family response regulator|nr:two-component system response regulator BtsR [Azoarcus sp.]